MKAKTAFLILLCLVAAGCEVSVPKPAKKALSAEANPLKVVMIMAGRVDAEQKADISSKISAKVAKVSVDVGTVTHTGQVLINLDTDDLQAQRIQAEAGIQMAQSNLARIESGSRPEQIIQAEAAMESTAQALEVAKNNIQRISELYRLELVSKSQFESTQAQLKSAEAQFISAKSQVAMLREGETRETLAVARAQVKQASTALDVIRAQLKNGVIVAPISGVVSAKNINPGELAVPGITLLQIVNPDSLFISAYLPVRLIPRVHVGQRVIVKVADLPERELPGQISAISTATNAVNKNILVKIHLIARAPLLKLGMFAEIGIESGV